MRTVVVTALLLLAGATPALAQEGGDGSAAPAGVRGARPEQSPHLSGARSSLADVYSIHPPDEHPTAERSPADMSIKDVNLAARFALELGALGALGYWGFQAGDSRLTRLGMGVGAPLLAAIAWGTVVAPRAPVQAAAGVRLGVEVAVFGSAVAALADSGHPRMAGAFAVAAVANRLLMFAWGQ